MDQNPCNLFRALVIDLLMLLKLYTRRILVDIVRTSLVSSLLVGSFYCSIAQSNDSVKKWTHPSLHPKADAIYQVAQSEQPETIPRTSPEDKRTVGATGAGLSNVLTAALESVQARYREMNKNEAGPWVRPWVADVGAGLGNATWKLIVAGGQVDAFELQRPAARIAQDRIAQKVKGLLQPGEKLRPLITIKVGDFLNYAQGHPFTLREGKYDFMWAGDVIHLMTPKQAQEFVRLLYSFTKTNGEVFATVHHIALSNPVELKTYIDSKNAGKSFPGYVATNLLYDLDPVTGMRIENKARIAATFLEEDAGLIPGQFAEGFYHPPFENQRSKRAKEIASPREAHVIVHFFDQDVLQQLFATAGFEVLELYHFNFYAQGIDITLSEREKNAIIEANDYPANWFQPIRIGIRARKR